VLKNENFRGLKNFFITHEAKPLWLDGTEPDEGDPDTSDDERELLAVLANLVIVF
jgi:hypothetical protein